MTSRMNPSHATPAQKAFPLAARAVESAGLGGLRHVASTGSTNEDLVNEARGGATGSTVLVADHQTSGRGRLDRDWQASPNEHLLVSFRLPASDLSANQVVVAVATAARRAAAGFISSGVGLKWPNDLVVSDGPAPGKLAGVLAEFVTSDAPMVVVGIGINIGRIEIEGATSITACGGVADRDRLLAGIVDGLDLRLSDSALAGDEVRRHSATLGTRVRVNLPGDRVIIGEATDLDDEGRLLVDDGHEVHVVSAGDVVRLRPEG